MKRILFFGDSNTWGYADSGQTGFVAKRYPAAQRWPDVAADLLGDGFEVLADGLNGRSTKFSPPSRDGHNALVYVKERLRDMIPLDLAVVALGINDLHPDRNGDVGASRDAMGEILDFLQKSGVRTILMLPALLNEKVQWPPYQGDASPEGAVARSKELHAAYRQLAEERGIPWVDAAGVAEAGEDGIHLTADSHVRLGQAVAKAVEETLSGDGKLTGRPGSGQEQ